jgi:hypothetical protein
VRDAATWTAESADDQLGSNGTTSLRVECVWAR